MGIVLDHTVVPVNNREESVEFYTRILGFEDRGEIGPFLGVAVNASLNLLFRVSDDFQREHYAFGMDSGEFDAVFSRVRESGIPYGNNAGGGDNMEGPGIKLGAKGEGKSIYFTDPSGHGLEIMTY